MAATVSAALTGPCGVLFVVFRAADGVMEVTEVRRPEGREFIRGLKPGDRVQITYSEALAVRVDKQ